MFVRDLLNRRLNQRLRYGERKAVYGASANLVMRGPAAYLQVSSRIDEDDYDFASAIIDEEIEYLRSGSLGTAEFEADRAAVIERLRGANQTAESLNTWTRQVFYDPATFTDFPDVLSFYENLSQSRVASFAAHAFDESRRVLSVSRTQPVSQGMAVLAVAVLIWITLKVVAWALTRPVRMRDIRYVAHFRLPVVLRTAYAFGLIAVMLALGRIAAAGIGWGVDRWLLPVDDYVIQHAAIAGMLVAGLVVTALLLTSFPRKLLIFEDHLRIKSCAWRSRILKARDIEEIALERGLGAWLSRGILRSPPLAFGLIGPGIHLRPVRGPKLLLPQPGHDGTGRGAGFVVGQADLAATTEEAQDVEEGRGCRDGSSGRAGDQGARTGTRSDAIPHHAPRHDTGRHIRRSRARLRAPSSSRSRQTPRRTSTSTASASRKRRCGSCSGRTRAQPISASAAITSSLLGRMR